MLVQVNHASMVPIYEQIVAQIKQAIFNDTLRAGAPLPSIRMLAGELQISALTVKKAYDALTRAGLVQTVPGKGSFVSQADPRFEREAAVAALQEQADAFVQHARALELADAEIKALVQIAMGESR